MKKFLLIFLVSLIAIQQGQSQNTIILDNTFAQNGWDTVQLSSNNYFKLKQLFVAPEEKLLVCGTFETQFEKYCPMLLRYNENGTIDATFGANGFRKIWDFMSTTPNMFVNAYAQRTDGRILLACFDNGTGWTFIYQLSPDGNLDSTFGENGLVTLTNLQYSKMSSMALQSDGKLVCFFDRNEFNNGRVYHALRLNIDGSLDATFGEAGLITISYPDAEHIYENVNNRVLIDNEGFIYLLFMQSEEFSVVPHIIRLSPTGAIDPNFAGNGVLTLPLEESFWFTGFSAVMLNNTMYIAASSSEHDEQEDEYYPAIRIHSIQTNGSYTSVSAISPLLVNDSYITNHFLAVNNGKYYISFSNESSGYIFVLNPDGSFDESINGNGIIPIAGIPDRRFNDYQQLAFDAQQRIYLGASYNNFDEMDYFHYTCRYRAQPVSAKSVTKESVTIYPNPAQDQIVIQGLSTPSQVQLHDIHGRVVQQWQQVKDGLLTFNTHPSGIYFVRIMHANGISTHKIIIN